MKNRKNIRLFTLVEMLTVVGLIAVLMGMTIAIIPMVNRRAANTRTEATLKMIETALANYKTKYGFYPPTLSGTNVVARPFILDTYTLTGSTTASSYFKNNMAQFFDIGASESDARGKMEAFTAPVVTGALSSPYSFYFIDAFGMPIIYRCPGYFNRNSYDLGSLGEDKKWGTISTAVAKNDIFAFTAANETTFYTNANGFGKGDDIVNFKRK